MTADAAFDRLIKAERLGSNAAVLKSDTYEYGDARFPFHITGVVGLNGVRYSSVTYDSIGRALTSEGPSGIDKSTVAYSDLNGSNLFTRTVTNALGKKAVYKYSSSSTLASARFSGVDGEASTNCPASTRSATWDGSGHIIADVDEEGRRTERTFTATGLMSTQTLGAGSASPQSTAYEWNGNNRPTKITQAGLTTDLVWTADGQLTTLTETDTSTQTVPYSTNGQTRVWSFAYGTGGLVTSVDGPLSGAGDKTVYSYTTSGYLATVTDAAGLVTTVTAWNGRGQPTSVTDPNGTVVAYAYDGIGRLTTVTQAPGSGASVWSFTYDSMGNVTKATVPTGVFLSYTYDTARRLTKVTDAVGATIDYTYDALGNVTKRVVKNASSATVFQEDRAYDELGRLIRLVNGTNKTWKTGWDRTSLPATLTDPRNGVVTLGFDAVTRIVSRTAEDAGVETLTYDGKSDVASYKDQKTLATSYVRNGFGDAIQETSPDRGKTVYEVDARGLVTKKTDARGIVATYGYDAAGRPTSKSFPASTAETVTFTWDGVAGGNKGKGRLTQVADRSGTTAFVYDAKGRLASETRTIGSYVHTTAYGFDAEGRLTRLTYPSGRVVDYGYDAMGRIASVTTRKAAGQALVGVAWWAEYLPYGQLRGAGLGNGATWFKTYDLAYQPDKIELTQPSPGAAPFRRYHPVSDGINIAGLNDDLDNNQDLWLGYDAANRLSSGGLVEGSVYNTYAYTYDKVGNRLTETKTPAGGTAVTQSYGYPATSNRLSAVTQGSTTLRSFLYDAAGNVTQDTRGATTTAYAYDHAGRLRTVTVGGSPKGTYTYDGMDRLAIRAVTNSTPSGTTHFLYVAGGGGAFEALMPGVGAMTSGLGNRVIAETNGAGVSLREYVWLGDQVLAVVDNANTANPTPYWVTNDHLGRPVQMTDANRAVVWRAKYRPFGEVSAVTGSASLDTRFPGQWFQLESGLSFNWHRHYDPTLGRYSQPDPLGIWAGPSVYGYAGQNPVMKTDPEGLAPKDRGFGLPKGFWNWYHKQCKKPGDPDLTKDDAEGYFDEWKRLGKPGPEKQGSPPAEPLEFKPEQPKSPWWLPLLMIPPLFFADVG